MSHVEPEVVARLPVEELAPGQIAPPPDWDDPSWATLSGWEDPLAPRTRQRVPSCKTRVDSDDGPAIEWARGVNLPRALITGERTWREYSVECRVQALQSWYGPSWDVDFLREAACGLAFRIETSRRYYFFCLEGQRRLVLYRRIDDEWHALAAADVFYQEETVTLRVELLGDGIRAVCPEHGVELPATDTLIRSGKAGFRARGRCRLFALKIVMTPSQQRLNRSLAEAAMAQAAHLSAGFPDEEEAGEIRLPPGGRLLACDDFCRAGRNDLLMATPEALIAMTWEGEELWRVPGRTSAAKVTTDAMDGKRRVYATMGEREFPGRKPSAFAAHLTAVASEIVAIEGPDGSVAGRVDLPEDENAHRVLFYDFARETGSLAGVSPFDFIVRPWRMDIENGGRDLWAYDRELNLLWHRLVDPPYGHHDAVRLFDIDGDGRAEVIAGGTVLSPEGKRIAQHDRAEEVRRIRGAIHYDAVWPGNFADDPELDPVAFVIAGSAGVYLMDPHTGRTLANHRIGHAQWAMDCKVRDDIPGRQVMAGTRWGNYGIFTLFSGRGERLWTIQPDYLLEGTCPVRWLADGPELIWVNTSVEGQGLYDGHGRRVKTLDRIRALWRGDPCAGLRGTSLRREPDGCDLLGVQAGERIHLFGPRSGG